MKKYLLGGKGNFYKAQLHLHTNISDGDLSPQEVKEAYMAKGYSIVAFTDHEAIVAHNDLSDENFLAITSYEQSVDEKLDADYQFKKTYHLNFYAKDKNNTCSPCFNINNVWEKTRPYVSKEQLAVNYPLNYAVEQVNDMLQKANENGFLVTLNHPVWSEQSYPDYIDLKSLWGIEVYNHDCAIGGMIDTDIPFDDLLKAGNELVPVATDDMHRIWNGFGSFTMIEAENLDYDNVLKAMEEKRLYASMGPIIEEVSIDGDLLTIRCSKASQICLNTDRRWHPWRVGEGMTEATFDLSDWREWNEKVKDRKKGFVRLVVIDEKGKKAWTRAYFEEELW